MTNLYPLPSFALQFQALWRVIPDFPTWLIGALAENDIIDAKDRLLLQATFDRYNDYAPTDDRVREVLTIMETRLAFAYGAEAGRQLLIAALQIGLNAAVDEMTALQAVLGQDVEVPNDFGVTQ